MTRNARHPSVVLDGVDVVVDGARILHDIVWRLDPADRWGIVGANGSGKSTLLRLIAGTAWPAAGKGSRCYDFGRGMQRDAVQARSEITLVGHELQDQYTKFGWNFSALDVVLSGVYRTDVPRRRPAAAETARARAIVDELGLADLAARPFLELSRGQQRRVLIARGFAFAPAVLLLDEPAAGLDAAARRTLFELLDRVGRTTPLVCAVHAHADLPPIVNRVVELEAGRIARHAARPPSAAPPADATAPAGARAPAQPASAPPADEPPTAAAAATGCAAVNQDEGVAAGGPRAAPLIDVEHACVWLGERRVLHDVSWRLHEREHWLVRGPNGAGKSSFLRLLHGQLRPSRGGRIRWPGLGDPADVWQLRRHVAWVSAELQAAYLYPSDVRQCLASGFTASIGQTRRSTTAESERVEQLVAEFELDGLEQRRLSSLSYGQRRRVLIARALACRPRILLLDEPWEGLDPATTRLVQARLRDAVTAGAQLVCVSHDDDDGAGLFSHVMSLDGGRVSAAGERPLRPARGGAAAERRESSASAPPREAGFRRP